MVGLNKTFFELLVLQKTIKMIMSWDYLGGGGGGPVPPPPPSWPPPGHTTACMVIVSMAIVINHCNHK